MKLQSTITTESTITTKWLKSTIGGGSLQPIKAINKTYVLKAKQLQFGMPVARTKVRINKRMKVLLRISKGHYIIVSAHLSILPGWIEWWTPDSQGVAKPGNWKEVSDKCI